MNRKDLQEKILLLILLRRIRTKKQLNVKKRKKKLNQKDISEEVARISSILPSTKTWK